MSGWTNFFDQDWLDQNNEAALYPEWPIFDPHHHLWSEPFPYQVPQLLADLNDGHKVLGTIYLEAHRGYLTEGPMHLRPSGETAFIAHLAEESDRAHPGPRICAGIVGAADLMGPLHELDALLDAHIAGGNGRFCGVRSNIFVSFDTETLAMYPLPAAEATVERPEYLAGAKLLASKNLTVDLVCTHAQLKHVATLASRVPNLRIVVDHLAPPINFGTNNDDGAELARQWKVTLTALAPHENVFLKLGGCANPMMSPNWPQLRALPHRPMPPTSEELAAIYRPFISHAIETLKPNRCMFESNFPIDRNSTSYRVLWNAYKLLASPYSESERNAVLADSAISTYRVPLARPVIPTPISSRLSGCP